MALKNKLVAGLFAILWLNASAETFTLKQIEVQGNKRIQRATILKNIPVKIGEEFATEQTSKIIRQLYRTNFFSDIQVQAQHGKLIIKVVERAIIGTLKFTGNKKITTKQLKDGLRNIGIAEGQEFNQATFSMMKQALLQQYASIGYHATSIDINVNDMRGGRVYVAVVVNEGAVSKISQINLQGNHAFSKRQLMKNFNLAPTRPWSFLTGSDKYSEERLNQDLEQLRYFYLNHGYLRFKVKETKTELQVNAQQTKRRVNLTVILDEGAQYRISNVQVNGDYLQQKERILKLTNEQLVPGAIFSRQRLITLQDNLMTLFSDIGHAMAEIRHDLKIDDQTKTVKIILTLIPNRNVYIRHIEFKGNHRTNEEVFRREMRLQEGGSFSLVKIRESMRRLSNLGYVKNLHYNVLPVEGTEDQVDLECSFEEESSIGVNVQAGYSDNDGFLYGASINDQNVFGSGREVGVHFENTKATQYYGVNYYNPYFTLDNIGLGLNAFFSQTNPNRGHGELNSYRSKMVGVLTSLHFPISDYTGYSLGLGFEHNGIGRSTDINKNMERFLDQYGTSFNFAKVTSSVWFRNLDQAIFPTSGVNASLQTEFYIPMKRDGLLFYKLSGTASWYIPLFKGFVTKLGANFGFGDGIGRAKRLPPIKNFFAGGIGSVRGFSSDTIGPEEDKNNGIGGSLLVLANANLIIPMPFDTVRTSLFVDAGTVDDNRFHFKDMRISYGIQLEWRTPIAPLLFSFAKVARKKAWDDTTCFQFSLTTGI